jgi:hypothetical protein
MFAATAKVVSGRGRAATAMVEQARALSEIMDREVISGSLNLVVRRPLYLKVSKAVYSSGLHHYWDAMLDGLPVFISRWDGAHSHVVEVFSDKHLRTERHLSDGDAVSLVFSRDIIDRRRSSSLLNLTVWNALWRYREHLAYRDGTYQKLICRVRGADRLCRQ